MWHVHLYWFLKTEETLVYHNYSSELIGAISHEVQSDYILK
jgi:hypothetical protein